MVNFSKKHLGYVIKKHPGPGIELDPQIEDFLVDAANEFIEKVIKKTNDLKKMGVSGEQSQPGSSIEDQEIMKFAMLNLFDVDVCLKKESEIRKNKKIRRDNKKRISLKLAESAYYG